MSTIQPTWRPTRWFGSSSADTAWCLGHWVVFAVPPNCTGMCHACSEKQFCEWWNFQVSCHFGISQNGCWPSPTPCLANETFTMVVCPLTPSLWRFFTCAFSCVGWSAYGWTCYPQDSSLVCWGRTVVDPEWTWERSFWGLQWKGHWFSPQSQRTCTMCLACLWIPTCPVPLWMSVHGLVWWTFGCQRTSWPFDGL